MRKLYVLNLIVILALLLSACASATTEVVVEEPVAEEPAAEEPAAEEPAAEEPAAEEPVVEEPMSMFNEAPMLADKVAAGELPPVDERVPANPQVVTPLVEQGKYGGTLRQGIVGTSVTWGGGLYTFQWENLVQWTADFSGTEPSIAEKVEVSDDAREYIFYFREGMKWSDGEPFGADDIMFYIEDVLQNEELNPSGGTDWLPLEQIEGFKAEKVGENAVKLTFPNPYGTFLYQLAAWGGRYFAQYPKHYLQEFHIKYNPDANALATEEGLEGWVQLFFRKGPDNWGNPDRFMDVPEYPSLGPWVVVEPIGAGTTAKFVRNPYYWKVDSQGNQLPYIDEVIITSYQDPETRTLAMLNGDLDFIKDPGENNREVYFDAVDQGKAIQIVSSVPEGGNTVSVHFNQTTKDPEKAALFANLDFKVGMSYAINRDEIIEVVFKGQGFPAQVSPLESSPLYNERLTKQYIEYDVAKANEYLDKVLPNKDAEGMRLRSDGERLSIIWTCLDQNYTGGDAKAWLQASELMVGYFKAVGVEVKLDVISDQVLGERRAVNDVEMFTFHGSEGGAGMEAIIDPRWHIAGEYWGYFGLGWNIKLFGSEEDKETYGVELSENALQSRALFKAATEQPTIDGQIAEMKKLLEFSAENLWTIGISRPPLGYQPLSSRMGNFPDGAIGGWIPGTHKVTRPEQWFLNDQ
jgi:peptide/nickel transport system substrate-binding protein